MPDQRITVTLPPALLAEERGDPFESFTHPVNDCAACGHQVNEGDPMRKVDGDWMHEQCAIKAITSADADAAWLLLADQVATRPSTFRASDIRAVMSNVARIARRASAAG